jgi:hypothetical protein
LSRADDFIRANPIGSAAVVGGLLLIAAGVASR